SEEHTSELQSLTNLVCRFLLGDKTCALPIRSEEHTSELQSLTNLVCRLRLLSVCCCIHVRLFLVVIMASHVFFFFFFNNTAPPEIYPLPLHDALPICTKSVPAESPSAPQINPPLSAIK